MHADTVDKWRTDNKGVKEDDRPPAPKPWFAHLSDYTPEALGIQLQVQESKGLALLACRDEFSGMLKALESDSKIGRGTGIAQMLEMFDVSVSSVFRLDGGVRQFEDCLSASTATSSPKNSRNTSTGKTLLGSSPGFSSIS